MADKKRDIRISFRKALCGIRMPGACYQVALILSELFVDNKTGACFPSHETIAKIGGLSVRAVRDAIRQLERQGLLTTARRGFRGSLDYVLQVPVKDAEVTCENDRPTSESDASKPADSRTPNKEKSDPQSGRFSSPNPADSRTGTYENLPLNQTVRTRLHMNQTERGPSSYGPTPPGCADFAIAQSSSNDRLRDHSHGGSLISEPINACFSMSKEEEEKPIVCPPTYLEQAKIVERYTGRTNVPLAKAILSRLLDETLTEKMAQEMVAAARDGGEVGTA